MFGKLGKHLVHIFFAFDRAPFPFGIDHHGGAHIACIQTATFVDAYIFDPKLLGARLHIGMQFLRAFGGATAIHRAVWSAVSAYEHMVGV